MFLCYGSNQDKARVLFEIADSDRNDKLTKDQIGNLWESVINILGEFERLKELAAAAEVRMKCPSEKLRDYCERVQEKFNQKGGKAKLVSESSS